MTQKQKAVKLVAEEVNGDVYGSYSGRGMYGKCCMGVTCSNSTEAIESGARHGLIGARVDNMGLDYIVYWTDVNGIGD